MQATLVELGNKTNQVKELQQQKIDITKERDDYRAEREKYFDLYTRETQATMKLAKSNTDYISANTILQNQKKLDDEVIGKQNKQIRWMKIEKVLYSGGSFALGFGAGYFYGNNRNNNNQAEALQPQGFRITF